MSVKVNANYGSGGGGIMHSPAFRVGEIAGGAYTGNPALIAGGLAKPGSPAGQAAGMYGMASKVGGGADPTQEIGAAGKDNLYAPTLGDEANNPYDPTQNALGGSDFDEQLAAMKRKASAYGAGGF